MPISNHIKNIFTRPSSGTASRPEARSSTSLNGKIAIEDRQFPSLDEAIHFVSQTGIRDRFQQRLFMHDINHRHQQKEISDNTRMLLNEAADRLQGEPDLGYELPRLMLDNYQSAREYTEHLSKNDYNFNLAISFLLSHHTQDTFEDDTSHYLLKYSFLEIANQRGVNNQHIPDISAKLHYLTTSLSQHRPSANIPPFKDHINNVVDAIKNRHPGTENINETIANYFTGLVNMQTAIQLDEALRERDRLPAPAYLIDFAKRRINSEGISLEAACDYFKIYNDNDINTLRSATTEQTGIIDNPSPPPEYSLEDILSAIHYRIEGTETLDSTVENFFPGTINLSVARQLEEALRERDRLPVPDYVFNQAETLVRTYGKTVEEACNQLKIFDPQDIEKLRNKLG